MCTVSWLFDDDGYELFCNRDETRQRSRAQPPRRSEQEGVAYLSPKDNDAGGTWIAVNELGLALCLLNRYPDPKSGIFTSRGWLIRELAGARGIDQVNGRLLELEERKAQRYRPFTLLALAPETPPLVAAWDGLQLMTSPGSVLPPLASSSYDPTGIGEIRRGLWEKALGQELDGREPSSEDLLALHASHRPERGPLSPCMHRDDARTVSLTHVRVTRAAVEMAYADGPPCRVALSRSLSLIRRFTGRSALRHVAPVV